MLPDYSRLAGSVDVELMKSSHIVAVGAGAAFSLYEALIRTFLGRLTVIDFDFVDKSNLVRQGYNAASLDVLKVVALGAHLRTIDTQVQYVGVPKSILDMTTTELDSIFSTADLLLFMTDSFQAQAFGNKLALRYGKPAIWAGHYPGAMYAEVVFLVQGITPACFRCAVSPRYAAQAVAPELDKPSSVGSTMLHSTLLDGFAGMIALAILHRHTRGLLFSNWFGREWKKNLVQFKLHPDSEQLPGPLFQRILGSASEHVPSFCSVWQEIKEECPRNGYPPCPDCGGVGDLSLCQSFRF